MKCDELQRHSIRGVMFNGEEICEGFAYYDSDEVDEAIAELKAENERLKKCEIWMKQHFYCEEVIACESAKNRRLKRALWLARAEICHRFDVDRYLRNHRNSWYNENCLTWADALVAMDVKMCKAESKCRAKAEEY
jgi:hypothetical protein